MDCMSEQASEKVRTAFSIGTLTKMLERAVEVANNPEDSTDSEKLRTIADFLDVYDVTHECVGDLMQSFLRDLADSLETQEI